MRRVDHRIHEIEVRKRPLEYLPDAEVVRVHGDVAEQVRRDDGTGRLHSFREVLQEFFEGLGLVRILVDRLGNGAVRRIADVVIIELVESDVAVRDLREFHDVIPERLRGDVNEGKASVVLPDAATLVLNRFARVFLGVRRVLKDGDAADDIDFLIVERRDKCFHVRGAALLRNIRGEQGVIGRKRNAARVILDVDDNGVQAGILDQFHQRVAQGRRAGRALAHVDAVHGVRRFYVRRFRRFWRERRVREHMRKPRRKVPLPRNDTGKNTRGNYCEPDDERYRRFLKVMGYADMMGGFRHTRRFCVHRKARA